MDSEVDGRSESETISGTPLSPHDRVEQVIRAHCGKENVIPADKIATKADINDSGNHTDTKDIIRDLLRDRHLPVGATNQGYYLMETRREVEDYLSTLRSRSHEINRRREMVEEAAKDAGIREENT